MVSIIIKNFYFYKRNPKELLLAALRSYLSIIPFYYFAIYQSSDLNDLTFTITTLTIVGLLSNIIIATNYELYREIISGKMINFNMANINISSYILAQTIFYFIVYSIQYIIIIIWLIELKLIVIKYSATLLINISIFLLMVVLLSAVIGGLFSVLTIKTNRFAYSSIAMSLMILVSACYMPYNLLSENLKKVALLSPFTYVIDIFRSFLMNKPGIFSYRIIFLILAIQTIILWMIMIKFVNKLFIKTIIVN